MKIILSIFLMLPLTLFAFQPQPFADSNPCFFVSGEWLYFSPTSETSYYAGNVELPEEIALATGERVANRFDEFFSGYRVSAAYLFCSGNRFIAASWAQLKCDHSDSVSGSTVFPVIAQPGQLGPSDIASAVGDFARDDKHFHWHALDVIVGQQFLNYNCLSLIGFVGIQYAYLSSNEDFLYNILTPIELVATGELRSRFRGVGPEIGINLASELGCGFFLEGTLKAGVIIGENRASCDNIGSFFSITDFNNEVENQKVWRGVPHTNIRIQLKYVLNGLFRNCAWNCFYGDLVIGYEAPIYFDALSNIIFTQYPDFYLSFDHYRNVVMHGPFIALTLGF